MKFRLSPEITEKIPGITVAVLVFKDLNNKKKSSSVGQLLRGVIAGKKRELKNEEEKKRVMAVLKQTSVDNKILKEANLLKSNLNKISTGKDLESKNNLLDLAHFLAMKYLVPLHGQDMDQTAQDIEVGFVIAKKGKKAEDLDYSADTVNAVLWLVDTGSLPKEDFEKLPDEFTKIIQKYCVGKLEAKYVLNADQAEVDLNYVSQKEIEYQELQKQEAERRVTAEKILAGNETPFMETAAASAAAQAAFALPEPPETLLKDRLAAAVKEALVAYAAAQNLDLQNLAVEIETPNDPLHGDYASNIALKIAKLTGKTPREAAEGIIQGLPALEILEKTEIAGPGFINFRLSQKFLASELDTVIRLKNNFGRLGIGADKKVLIEYSQPNIAKPLGVHHLLSTIIGQTLVNIYRFAGFDVLAVNYPGDWGTQFGKLLYAYKNWGDAETVKKDPLNELLKLYVRFHNEAEKDPLIDDKGREEFKKLEEGDEQNKHLWQWIKDLSIEEIERLYRILDVRFDLYLGEQMYLDAAKEIVKEGLEKGIFTIGERGAIIAQFENEKYPPFMVQKADGTTLYSTRDIASIKDRLERFHPGKIVYVVDVAQSLHFKQLFETAHKFGFTGTEGFHGAELVHVVFGRMQLPAGAMSTRKGEVVLLDEVIKEAVSRTEKLIAEKSPELPPAEQKFVAEQMAVSAIKYNIISQNRETNITFDWDRMLSLEGNSGPYLEYAYARAQSIIRKHARAERSAPAKKVREAKTISNQTDLFSMTAEKSAEKRFPDDKKTAPFGHEAEKRLMRLLPKFAEAVEIAVREYKPNLLTNYLFELARAFNSFYNEVPVLNAATEELKSSRLKIVQAVGQVLHNGLKVLGIAVFERM